MLPLPAIAPEKRRDEARFWDAFHTARPRLLGALLDAVSATLRTLPAMHLRESPRMADFVRWACAAALANHWSVRTAQGVLTGPDAFLSAYAGNIQTTRELELEASLLAHAVQAFVERVGTWQGTATNLLHALQGQSAVPATRGQKWPKSPHALSVA